eukprot:TRINITY_DN1797_c0_g1_i1.p1 TRINITY_DN1797_c0_g1~~TRINITY_DN1797_c0_g1_i1.p1  ORF type:complete len:501 (+),score=51.30 TRINITY_DN1797_c0_g1_i1:104-1606(+)
MAEKEADVAAGLASLLAGLKVKEGEDPIKVYEELLSGKRTGVDDDGTEWRYVTPSPGFVVKGYTKTIPQRRVFINVVHHPLIDPPAPFTADDGSTQYRIPLSCGPRHIEKAHDGSECAAYDIIVSSDTLKRATAEADFKAFVSVLTLNLLADKHETDLDTDRYTTPRVQHSYKGPLDQEGHPAPAPHRVRVGAKGAKAAPSSSTAGVSDGDAAAASAQGPISSGRLGSMRLPNQETAGSSGAHDSRIAADSVPSGGGGTVARSKRPGGLLIQELEPSVGVKATGEADKPDPVPSADKVSSQVGSTTAPSAAPPGGAARGVDIRWEDASAGTFAVSVSMPSGIVSAAALDVDVTPPTAARPGFLTIAHEAVGGLLVNAWALPRRHVDVGGAGPRARFTKKTRTLTLTFDVSPDAPEEAAVSPRGSIGILSARMVAAIAEVTLGELRDRCAIRVDEEEVRIVFFIVFPLALCDDVCKLVSMALMVLFQDLIPDVKFSFGANT